MQMTKHIHEWFASGNPETTKIGIVSDYRCLFKLRVGFLIEKVDVGGNIIHDDGRS